MAKSIKLKNSNYIDSSSISHRRENLKDVLDLSLRLTSSGRIYSLKEFIEKTAIGDTLCGTCRIYTEGNFFNIDSADWVKVFYMYQNAYNAAYPIHGIALVAKQSGKTYLVVLEGQNGSYTATAFAIN